MLILVLVPVTPLPGALGAVGIAVLVWKVRHN
jgi:hypothetical protein